jgi:nicotinate-nucleotide pyrophosphorylase (carboxylating)
VNSPPPALSKFKKRVSWEDIDKSHLLAHLELCVQEDLSNTGDLTSDRCQISGNGVAEIVTREEMIICGLSLIPIIFQVFEVNSLEVENLVDEGVLTPNGTTIAKLSGKQSDILKIERTVLNFIQRLSGIATSSNLYAAILSEDDVHLLDTRKTTPGIRSLEKFASACGGSYNHRMGLFDRILIKDNHLAASNIVTGDQLHNFLIQIKKKSTNDIVQVEIDSIEYLEISINAGVDAILLDNFSPDDVKRAVLLNKNRVVIEASGGISFQSLKKYARAQPHFVSTGAPIHGSRWMDIGLDWK